MEWRVKKHLPSNATLLICVHVSPQGNEFTGLTYLPAWGFFLEKFEKKTYHSSIKQQSTGIFMPRGRPKRNTQHTVNKPEDDKMAHTIDSNEKPSEVGAKVQRLEEASHSNVNPADVARELGASVIYREGDYFTLSKPARDFGGKVNGTLIHGINAKGMTHESVVAAFIELGY